MALFLTDTERFSRANALLARATALSTSAFRQSVATGMDDDYSDLDARIDALEQAAFKALPLWKQRELEYGWLTAATWDAHERDRLATARAVACEQLERTHPYVCRLVERIHAAARFNPAERRIVAAFEARLDAMTQPRKAELAAQRRALVPVEQAPCRAIVPLTFYIDPIPTPSGLRFAARGTSESYPTWSACRWTTDFLGGSHQWLA